jgi:pimeloyl-ACP methyl ester carboxylesterase
VKNMFLCGAAALALLSPAIAAAQPTHTLAEDAAAFGARQSASRVSLSPDGKNVLYLTPGPGPKTFAVISNLETGKSQVVTSTDGKPENLSWCSYASADRIVCSIYAIVDTMGWPLTMSRKISMNTDGGDAKLLGKPGRNTDSYLSMSDGYVLDWRQAVDGKVLMARTYVPEEGKMGTMISDSKEGLGVDLVDTRTLKSTPVELPSKQAAGFMTDHVGNVRIMRVVERDRDWTLTGRDKYFYRTKGDRKWRPLTEFQKDQFEALSIDTDTDQLYALKRLNGRYALYRIALDGTLAETFVASDPKYDIGTVLVSNDGKKVVGYALAGERVEKTYFDPGYKALVASLARAMPKTPNIAFADSTPDGNKLLIFAGSDQEPGRYYLFDRNAKTLNEAMLARPELEKFTLAEMKPVTITGAGGVQIPAYLTLPPGKDPKNLPAIVMPHGGPSSRDYWGYDWLSQFFAARGYAVIKPQFRGSTGFGEAWENDNALKNWRAAMTDVASSVHWLTSQGIADPKRVAIFGWSYGGYAALQSAVTNPELYKAVIAVAPLTDFNLLKADNRDYVSSKIVNEMVGGGIEVERGSPLKNAARIQAPVLLVHGSTDVNVSIRHSDKMAAALKGLGKPVEYLRYDGLDHQLPDATATTEMLLKSAELLERTIGR